MFKIRTESDVEISDDELEVELEKQCETLSKKFTSKLKSSENEPVPIIVDIDRALYEYARSELDHASYIELNNELKIGPPYLFPPRQFRYVTDGYEKLYVKNHTIDNPNDNNQNENFPFNDMLKNYFEHVNINEKDDKVAMKKVHKDIAANLPNAVKALKEWKKNTLNIKEDSKIDQIKLEIEKCKINLVLYISLFPIFDYIPNAVPLSLKKPLIDIEDASVLVFVKDKARKNQLKESLENEQYTSKVIMWEKYESFYKDNTQRRSTLANGYDYVFFDNEIESKKFELSEGFSKFKCRPITLRGKIDKWYETIHKFASGAVPVEVLRGQATITLPVGFIQWNAKDINKNVEEVLKSIGKYVPLGGSSNILQYNLNVNGLHLPIAYNQTADMRRYCGPKQFKLEKKFNSSKTKRSDKIEKGNKMEKIIEKKIEKKVNKKGEKKVVERTEKKVVKKNDKVVKKVIKSKKSKTLRKRE